VEIFSALGTVLTDPVLMLAVALAAFVGIIVGAVPGLTAAAAIAMLLPLTYHVQPLLALTFLYVIGKSGRYGGSISAILFNTPGTSASAATQLDGYPLAQAGKAGKAMKVATIASVLGDLIGDILLIVGIGWIAAVALKLGPPELFAIYLSAFLVIGSVIGKSVVKGLASAFLGVVVSMIGLDPISGQERYTFDILELSNGVGLVPLMIGVFVLGEVFAQLENKADAITIMKQSTNPADNAVSWAEFKPCVPHVIRGGLIGSFIGILPGLGSAIAAFVSYGEGKRRAKNPEMWGKGALEGIAAPESANNAVSGPSMAPLLILGIPGSTIGAILMGVFLIHGIQIGPTLFSTSKDLIFQLFASGLVGIAVYGLMGYFGAAWFGKSILRVPTQMLYPSIFLITFIAAYSGRGSVFDVLVMVLAGVLGWLMRKYDFNVAAFVIAYVLARGAEEAFRQSLLLSDSGFWIFIQHPFSAVVIALGFGVMVMRARSLLIKGRRAKHKQGSYA
jgi:putative tricarboxylic transport membrane protein